jgi:hypothetical protein
MIIPPHDVNPKIILRYENALSLRPLQYLEEQGTSTIVRVPQLLLREEVLLHALQAMPISAMRHKIIVIIEKTATILVSDHPHNSK